MLPGRPLKRGDKTHQGPINCSVACDTFGDTLFSEAPCFAGLFSFLVRHPRDTRPFVDRGNQHTSKERNQSCRKVLDHPCVPRTAPPRGLRCWSGRESRLMSGAKTKPSKSLLGSAYRLSGKPPPMPHSTAPTADPAPPALLLDVTAAAALIGMSTRWLWRAVSAGDFPLPIKIGGATRWRRSEVDAWVEDLA